MKERRIKRKADCKKFLSTKEKFKWFIIDMFGGVLMNWMEEAARKGNEEELHMYMRNIFNTLPYTFWRHRNEQPGWKEFEECMTIQ